jgi:hypothetical protein
MFGAKAQRASLLGDFCNKICHKPTYAAQQMSTRFRRYFEASVDPWPVAHD